MTLRILLAEDDPLLRSLVGAQLRAIGYEVVEAQSGEEALSILVAGQEPDVLVTDISMPGALDGWALGEQSRSRNPKLPVIYTTSGRPEADRQVAGSLFIAKPYRPDVLIAAVRTITRTAGADGEPGL